MPGRDLKRHPSSDSFAAIPRSEVPLESFRFAALCLCVCVCVCVCVFPSWRVHLDRASCRRAEFPVDCQAKMKSNGFC